MAQILVVGHSHVFPLRLALARHPERAEGIEVCAIHAEKFSPEITDGVLHPGLAARVAARAWDAMFLSVGGAAHVVLGLVPHRERFDVILPEAPDLPVQPGARILPHRLVHAIMEQRSRPMLDTMAELARLGAGRKFAFAYPPPPC